MEIESRRQNREVAVTIGDLVETLYSEVEVLPLSTPAKQTLVMIMLSEIMRQEGNTITFYLPPSPGKAAA